MLDRAVGVTQHSADGPNRGVPEVDRQSVYSIGIGFRVVVEKQDQFVARLENSEVAGGGEVKVTGRAPCDRYRQARVVQICRVALILVPHDQDHFKISAATGRDARQTTLNRNRRSWFPAQRYSRGWNYDRYRRAIFSVDDEPILAFVRTALNRCCNADFLQVGVELGS